MNGTIVMAETSEAVSASKLPVPSAAERASSLFVGKMFAVEAADKLFLREVTELVIFSLIFCLCQRYLHTGD